MRYKIWNFSLFIVAVLGIWESVIYLDPGKRLLMPPPSSIVSTLLCSRHILCMHTLVTLSEMIEGFCLSLFLAFPCAWFMLRFKAWGILLQGVFVVIQCIPMFALAPLMVLWLGWNRSAIVCSTALMIFFPLVISIYKGFTSTPKAYLDFFKVHQATHWQSFTKLQFPFAAPHIFSGLRIGLAISGIGAIAGEWAGAEKGLGVLMLESRQGVDLELTFAALTCLILLSLSFYGMSVVLERNNHILKTLFQRYSKPMHSLIALLVFSSSFVTGGCSHQDNKPKESYGIVRLALDWTPCPNHVPLYAGIAKHYFLDEGIDLQVCRMRDCVEPIPLLCSGGVDLVLSHQPRSLKAFAKGAQIQMIGRLIEEPLCCFMMMKEGPITNKKDLNGCRLGYSGSGFGRSFHDVLLDQENIQVSKKLNVNFDLVGALVSGGVDAIYGAYWNIESEQLLSLGYETKYILLREFGVPDYDELLVLARQGSFQANSRFIESFHKGMQKSIDFCRENPEKAFELYVAMNPNKSDKILAWEKRSWIQSIPLLAKIQTPARDKMQCFVDWMKKQGLLDSSVNIDSFISFTHS